MMKLSVSVLALLLVCSSSTMTARNQESKAGSRLSPVRLLPSYKIQWASGIDTWGGTIWKDNGVKIEFNQGGVGIATDQVEKDEVVWREEQVLNGEQVVIIYTKSSHLLVAIPKLIVSFEAEIRNQKDLAEMLLMALTWDMAHGYPAEPGAIQTTPKTTR
jgi:hypothetical protein